MEFTAFSCQVRAERPDRDIPIAADAAVMGHLLDPGPVRWTSIRGGLVPSDRQPTGLQAHRLVRG